MESKHHIVPTSRGGPKNGWNKRFVDPHEHAAIHTLFANLLPDEMILIIKYSWSDENGLLKNELLGRDQLKAWFLLFGTDQTAKAVEIISQAWNLTPAERAEWEAWKTRRKKRLQHFTRGLKERRRGR